MGTDVKRSNSKLRMFPETITTACLQVIRDIGKLSHMRGFYLVGGTSLALQLGHRQSIDLDFFSQQMFNPQVWPLVQGESVIVRNEAWAQSEIRGTRVDFMYFAYPYHYPLIPWEGINLMSADDIGLFKLLALTGRNRKKDIVDLYFIDKEVKPLYEVIRDFATKYHHSDVNMLRQVEQLFNDEAIAASDMPVMLKPFDWETGYAEVKEKILAAIKAEIGVNLETSAS